MAGGWVGGGGVLLGVGIGFKVQGMSEWVEAGG